jgi:hypothetical protein
VNKTFLGDQRLIDIAKKMPESIRAKLWTDMGNPMQFFFVAALAL